MNSTGVYQRSRDILLLALIIGIYSANTVANTQLDKIERSLEEASNIEQLSNEIVLNSLNTEDSKTFVFDVRTEEEFSVSHLPNAVRLDPDMAPNDFLRDYGELLEEATVIFYCSTGRRSTKLAESITEVLESQGKFTKPANMKGGIFRWHNESKPLVNADSTTDKVHPYNWYWRRLLSRKDKTSYTP